MKRLFIAVTATLACVGAFGQGKLSFDSNDGYHLIYLTTDTSKLVLADRTTTVDGTELCGGILPLAGNSLYTGLTLSATPGTIMSLSGSPTFIVGLYGGTSSNSLSLQTTTTIDDLCNGVNPGGIVPVDVTFNNLPIGTPAYFQVQVFDSRASSYAPGGGAADAWTHANWYAGVSQIFQAIPTTNYYAPIWLPTSPVNSTWAPGTFVPTDLQCFEGAFGGAIEVYVNPNSNPPPPPASGSLQVMISPPAAITDGACYLLDSGVPYPFSGWHGSGEIVSGLWPGGHWLSFRPIPGWFTPPDASVLVYSGQTTAMGVTYVPVEINLTALQMRADGAFQFAFTNAEVRTFSAYGTTNLSQPFSNWTFLGHITEDGPGRFLFTDLQATNTPQRFYRVRREAYSPYGLNR